MRPRYRRPREDDKQPVWGLYAECSTCRQDLAIEAGARGATGRFRKDALARMTSIKRHHDIGCRGLLDVEELGAIPS